ncbi:DNA polymerase III subunit epsilon [Perkinsela sp. CCAP 1560/4]|nr:DNA polymerase III subunit epsilon [Perkinsela sp. CCAP 1560/4]|eukprot:KNH07003.1 DNA polymerase III subunit epsilon [Perkinsela sp. CCAP 1560/4]
MNIPAFRTQTFQKLQERYLRTVSPLYLSESFTFPRKENDREQCCCFRCPCLNTSLEKNFTKHPHRAVVVDIETTGTSHSDQIIQIGAVEVIGSLITGNCFDVTVKPTVPINPMATSVHGICEAHYRRECFPALKDVFDEFNAFVGSSLVVCHNTGFDVKFLKLEGERVGLPFTPQSILCTMKLFRSIFVTTERESGNVLKKSNLDFVSEYFGLKNRLASDQFGVQRPTYHSAISDAMLTAKVYCTMHRLGMAHVHH